MLLISAGVWFALTACTPAEPPFSDSVLETRTAAFFLLDQDAMFKHADTLLVRAEVEPNQELRHEIVRQLGYARAPQTLPFLSTALTTDDFPYALESLAYYGPDGCDVLAEFWIDQELDSRDRIAYIRVLRRRVPDCLHSFKPYLDTEPERVEQLVKRLTGMEHPALEELRR